MVDIIKELISQFGYFGVFFLIAVENIFPPIPSEVILPFSGFATTFSSLTVVGVIMASTLGSIFGAIFLYGVGIFLNVERLERLIDSKLGRILRLKKKDVEKADKWFLKHGNRAVFIGRFIPIVRSLISVPAGMAKMNFVPFIIYTAIGTIIWNTVLISLGAIMGENWPAIGTYLDLYKEVVWIFIGVVVILYFVWKKYKKVSKKV